MRSRSQVTLVTGVIGDDAHGIGIMVLEHALKAAGYNVVSLGIQTSQKEFIDAALETNAAAIMVSSHSGHAKMLCEGLRERCMEAGLNDITLYLGGQLTIDANMSWEEISQMFKRMGFNRVCPQTVLPGEVIAYLDEDLGINTEQANNMGNK